uniref:Uncharacterized protein n=1 Tax=Panagrolaimus davidi TaxID=227884 RepID=A0A914PE02_9BILA
MVFTNPLITVTFDLYKKFYQTVLAEGFPQMAQLYHFLSKAIRDALQIKKTDKRSIGSNRNSFDNGGPAYLSNLNAVYSENVTLTLRKGFWKRRVSHEYIEMKEFCPPSESSLDTAKIISQQTSTNSFKPEVVADTVTKQKVLSDAEVRDINSTVNEFEYADFYWEDDIRDYLHPEDESQVTAQK